jgi:hypothetical protein
VRSNPVGKAPNRSLTACKVGLSASSVVIAETPFFMNYDRSDAFHASM